MQTYKGARFKAIFEGLLQVKFSCIHTAHTVRFRPPESWCPEANELTASRMVSQIVRSSDVTCYEYLILVAAGRDVVQMFLMEGMTHQILCTSMRTLPGESSTSVSAPPNPPGLFTPINTSSDIPRADHRIYEDCLIHLRHGFPLWEADPGVDPAIQLGDVGFYEWAKNSFSYNPSNSWVLELGMATLWRFSRYPLKTSKRYVPFSGWWKAVKFHFPALSLDRFQESIITRD